MNKKQQRQQKLQRQQALLNAAREANRTLSAEEQAEFDGLTREIAELTTQIEAEERSANPANPANPTGTGAPTGNPAAPTAQQQTPPPSGGDDTHQRAITAERERIANITALCRDFRVEDTELQRFITEGTSEADVQAAILQRLRANGGPINTRITVTNTGEDDFRRDVADGLLLRSGITLENPSAGARQMTGMSLRDIGIECLERADYSGARRLSSDQLFSVIMERQYYNPTAAFPAILDQTIEKAYVEGHRTAAVTFDLWTRKGSLKDFKVHDNYYIAGPVGDFLEVPEGGELKNDIPKDAKRPTRQLKTYGKQFTLSRQAFINDDIDLVTRIPSRYAAAARRTINTQCYRILMDNPKIYDGKQLFHKDHGNLITTGTGITQAALQAMILALSTQKDEFDQPIIVRPGAIIVPAGLTFDLYTIFNSPYIHTDGNTQAVNPLYQYRDLRIIEDPTINALAGGFGNVMPWFMAANSTDSAFIEVDYLNGQEVPTIRRMETPGQLGFVWDIYLDWGINVMDFRGAIKNNGVAIKNPLGDE